MKTKPYSSCTCAPSLLTRGCERLPSRARCRSAEPNVASGRRLLIAATVAIVALGLVGSGEAAPSRTAAYAHYYIDELAVSNALERFGFTYGGRKIPVDNAFCSGLRRYGARASEYGLDKFWRFKCTATSASNRFYTVQASTTTGPHRGYIYYHWLSAKLDF